MLCTRSHTPGHHPHPGRGKLRQEWTWASGAGRQQRRGECILVGGLGEQSRWGAAWDPKEIKYFSSFSKESLGILPKCVSPAAHL